MTIGDKIRLTDEIIGKFDIPQDAQEGVIVDIPLYRGGAFIKHSNGMIYAWDFSEFEVIE